MAIKPRGRPEAESGVSTVEVVIAAPLLLILMLFVVYLGLRASLTGQVQSAADDAARMGSAQHSQSVAGIEADDAANADLGKGTCNDVGGVYPQVATGGPFTQSGYFTATVTCTRDVLGISVTVVETGISPLDTFRETN